MTIENDPLAAFWMPFTANRAYKAHPRQLAATMNMHYWACPWDRAATLRRRIYQTRNGVVPRVFLQWVVVRATGDIITLPPLILDKTHIDQMFGKIGDLREGIG